MKQKYPELTLKCKNCTLGCYRLEDPNFIGIYRCEFFTEGDKENDNNNTNTLQK